MMFVEFKEHYVEVDITKITHVEQVTEPVNQTPIPNLPFTSAHDLPSDFVNGVRLYVIGGASVFLEGFTLADWRKLRDACLKQVQAGSGLVRPNGMHL